MRLLLLSILVLVLTFNLASCKRECSDPTNPDCDNYDPCLNSRKLTADFDIYEVFNYSSNWVAYDTDSLFSIDAKFVAKDEGVEYEWKIGAETIKSKEVTRKNFPKGVGIPITLKVKRKDGFNCYPTDSSTIRTRTIKVVDLSELRFKGCFQGYNSDNLNDTFTVCIHYDTLPFPQFKTKTEISGLIKKPTCTNNTFTVTGKEEMGYKQYIFNSTEGDCFSPIGRVRVDSGEVNSIRIDYSYYQNITDLERTIHKSFIGKRIK